MVFTSLLLRSAESCDIDVVWLYLDVSLADARTLYDAGRKLLASGVDPMAKRKAEKIARKISADNSFKNVAALWPEQKPPLHHGNCEYCSVQRPAVLRTDADLADAIKMAKQHTVLFPFAR